MAIVIDNWSNKSGKCLIEQNGNLFDLNLYAYGTSNCFLVAVYEYEDTEDHKTKELMQWFFMDERHGKIMLGLQKNGSGEKENCLTDVRRLTLYKNNCTDWKKIAALFAQAFDKITIEILAEQPKEEEENT